MLSLFFCFQQAQQNLWLAMDQPASETVPLGPSDTSIASAQNSTAQVTIATTLTNSPTPELIRQEQQHILNNDESDPSHAQIYSLLTSCDRMAPKRRRGMQKMVIIGSRISAACGELIPNPKGEKFRRLRERLLGTVKKSIGGNQYEITFDDGSTKQLKSSTLRIEPKTAGLPPCESADENVLESVSCEEGSTVRLGNTSEYSGNSSSANEDSTEHMHDVDDQIDEEEHLCVVGEIDDAPDDAADDGINCDDPVNVGDLNLPADADASPQTYHEKLGAKRRYISSLIGRTVSKTHKKTKTTMEWTVVEKSTPNLPAEVYEARDIMSPKIGLNNLAEFLREYGYEKTEKDYGSCSMSQTLSRTSSNENRKVQTIPESTIFAELFLKLMYKDWEAKVQKMNQYIDESNADHQKRTINKFEKWDFLVAHALLIGASCFCQSGSILFGGAQKDESTDAWDTILQKPRFDKHMKLYRFKEFRMFFPKIFEQPQIKDHDPWWAFIAAVNDFNEIREKCITSSWIKGLDESMSAWRPRTSKNGGLPNISFIKRKPEPLGTEFKTVCCPVSGVMTRMEIQRGNYIIYVIIF